MDQRLSMSYICGRPKSAVRRIQLALGKQKHAFYFLTKKTKLHFPALEWKVYLRHKITHFFTKRH